QSLGYNLVSHSDNTEQPFTFFVVNDTGINAFAGPGGVIGMNSGVILNSANESEVAAVMAHEIAHVTQRHLARLYEELNRYSVPTTAAIVGAILVGIANPQAGAAALTGIQGLSVQNQINFTRGNEEEADRIGIQTLVRAGYDPNGMPDFFLKLQQLSRFNPSVPEFLRTHPLTTSRIADSKARAESYPLNEYKNSHTYKLVKNKLLVNSFKSASEAARHLRKELETTDKTDSEKLPVRYGLAYAYIANSEFKLARQQIKKLLKDNPDHSAYLLLAAKLETSQSNYNDAFKIFKKAYELYPDYKPVIMAYSRALLDVKQAKQARDILKNYERFHTHDLNSYSLLGQAEAMLGNDIETAILQSEYYYLAGDTKLAVDKLKFVKQQYKLDYYQDQRVSARMAEFEYELELEKNIKL
ncbi:MAG: M48 family metalloprotease, partial [Proteobacteria bacterium]|nr:M48 family metalloprotease [Pseudomonadota bacterium]